MRNSLNPISDVRRGRRDCRTSGFTLVEMLVVIAIIAVLSALVLPSISSLSIGRASENSLFQLSRAVELARSEALARATYTWLAVMNTTDSEGRPGVSYSVFASRDGTITQDATNLSSITRPVFLPDLEIIPESSMTPEMPGVPATAIDVSTTTAMSASNAGVDYAGGSESYTLTFSPQGELILDASPTPASPFDRWAMLPVAILRDEQHLAQFDAVLVLAGGTGNVRVLRR